MKSFRAFMKEETVPFANIRNGSLDIRDTAVQDNLNSLLSGVTSEKFVTPYIAYQRVSKVLASYHIFIPSNTFLEGDSGHLVHTVNQYGPKFGQMSDGSFVVNGEVRKDYTHGPHEGGENNEVEEKPTFTDYFLYFEYRMSDCGMFKIFCEVVDRADLEEIMNDLEAEFDEEVVEDDLNEESVDFSQVTRDVKTGKLSTKNPKIDLSKVKMDKVTGSLSMRESSHKNVDEACWDTHKQVGMKKKGNRMVPDCVPKESVDYSRIKMREQSNQSPLDKKFGSDTDADIDSEKRGVVSDRTTFSPSGSSFRSQETFKTDSSSGRRKAADEPEERGDVTKMGSYTRSSDAQSQTDTQDKIKKTVVEPERPSSGGTYNIQSRRSMSSSIR